jgi:mRNA interferase RelE/StbE
MAVVKTVRYERRAVRFLARTANRATQIREKITLYAANPQALAANVVKLRGRAGCRLRVGDFRVLFEETETEIVVLDIGPRGGIYD